jgi:hypothetical protein
MPDRALRHRLLPFENYTSSGSGEIGDLLQLAAPARHSSSTLQDFFGPGPAQKHRISARIVRAPP